MALRFLFGCVWILLFFTSLFSCAEVKGGQSALYADSLNLRAYSMRYKNLDECERLASEALDLSGEYDAVRAEALNHLGFCSFIRMDFEASDSLLDEVYQVTSNELECLVADVGKMKICQRTAMNKEFYDYRNSALKRMKRIENDWDALANPSFKKRFHYACTEFFITSAIYYYYLQQEHQSLEALEGIDVEEELMGDTAQLLYYYYMKGSGGMYEGGSPEDVLVGEFDYLLNCLVLSHERGYVYFEANALQAMAELMKTEANFQLLTEKRPVMMRIVNPDNLIWEECVPLLSEEAIRLFKQYGDWYQISGSYRTLASCLNEQHRYEEALGCLEEALTYVNLHHEKYYHCSDTTHRLKPYVPLSIHSVELQWINKEGIRTVPEWIARIREQLSVTYAALGMKPQSDYNRNIYLDILDYTRQDKELESRYMALQKESAVLSMLLSVVVFGLLMLVLLLYIWNKFWRKRNTVYIDKLKQTLDISRQIIAAAPADAEEVDDIVSAITQGVKGNILSLVGEATDMRICVSETSEEETDISGKCTVVPLETGCKLPLGTWEVYSSAPLKKDDKALLKIIAPYIAWTLENGLSLISLCNEHKRIEKEQYVYERHLTTSKRRNIVKKACLFIVTGITPYIDRVINEIHKLTAFNYLSDKDIKESKYRYISELTTRINEYNDILALWVKMKQGSLSLNIENFNLNDLFQVLQKSRRTFEAKQLSFEVERADVLVKADKALTLFMISTLAENARKYTPKGGSVRIYAEEEENYVEVSVKDTGMGLSAEDVKRILGEKVYDSAKIGLQDAADVEDLKKKKGYGFGLMNCKGIIEKYRKTNDLFKVCCFNIESEPGRGSRFFFRLPKGGRKALIGWMCAIVLLSAGCSSQAEVSQLPDVAMEDSLLGRANDMANRVYYANVEGHFEDAVLYADSALDCLNRHYQKYSGKEAPLLESEGSGQSAELVWFADLFDTDYYTLLDVRNELAVAHLALGNREAYRYNNDAYTSLYRQISVDRSLESYYERMQQSALGKLVAIVLCIVLLVVLCLGYYWMYLRHLLAYRFNLEQVFRINRSAISLPLSGNGVDEWVALLVGGLYKDMCGLLPMEGMGIAVYEGESSRLCTALSSNGVERDAIIRLLDDCCRSARSVIHKEKGVIVLPLSLEVGDEHICTGALALWGVRHVEHEDNCLMLKLVASYLAVIVYHAVELIARKHHDIELAHDEARRLQREENLLHVQNMVLDNCLSTIKHETIYYPNRIRQIVEKLNRGQCDGEERQQVETMAELVAYYKDVFTILSSCASRQLEEITFRRVEVRARELAEHASRYMQKVLKKARLDIDWRVDVDDVVMSGDIIQLDYLFENLIDEAVSCPLPGVLELKAYREGAFVRFDFIDYRRTLTQEELNMLFFPHLSKMNRMDGEMLQGTEYLICKQIIREHDEYAGRRGCRFNADRMDDGGFMVWFTIPAR